MHSPLTHTQLVVAAFLCVQSFLLFFACPPIWRRCDWGAFSRAMVGLCRVLGVLVGMSGGALLWQWVMYGMQP